MLIRIGFIIFITLVMAVTAIAAIKKPGINKNLIMLILEVWIAVSSILLAGLMSVENIKGVPILLAVYAVITIAIIVKIAVELSKTLKVQIMEKG